MLFGIDFCFDIVAGKHREKCNCRIEEKYVNIPMFSFPSGFNAVRSFLQQSSMSSGLETVSQKLISKTVGCRVRFFYSESNPTA